MQYVGSREWLDTLNRLYAIDHGWLPPARENPAPTLWASPWVKPAAGTNRPLQWHIMEDAQKSIPCPCAKCQKGR